MVIDSKLEQSGTRSNANFGITANREFIVGYVSDADVEGWIGKQEIVQLVAGVVWLVRNGENYVKHSLQTEDMSVQDTGGSFVNTVSARTAIGHDAHGRLVCLLARLLNVCGCIIFVSSLARTRTDATHN